MIFDVRPPLPGPGPSRSSVQMQGIARGRLAEERKAWRKDHPFGFVARPETAPDGSVNLLKWSCNVPGKKGTQWEKGLYPVTLEFTEDYPSKCPKASLPAGFFHPNIYPSGKVCLSILNDEKGWKPSVTIKQILTGIQELLDTPNNSDAAQEPAWRLYHASESKYMERVKQEVKRYTPTGVL